jgi:uncharacterized lipoprotein YddW (UPF0748 family)
MEGLELRSQRVLVRLEAAVQLVQRIPPPPAQGAKALSKQTVRGYWVIN